MFGDICVYFESFVDDLSRRFGVHHKTQRRSPRFVCGLKEAYRETYRKEDQGTPFG